MQTLIFYSYKGGQGRSTAVANIATALSRLGKSVLVLDLDVESPGLPPKLIGESVFEGDMRGVRGIVSYIIDLIDHPIAWKDGKGAPPSIEPHTIEIKEDRSFLLIPTGLVTPQYENLLAQNAWQDFVRRDRINDYRYMTRRVKSLDQINVAVQALSPAIDFFLVDLASGMTPLAQSIFAAWAGPILLFFSLDQENIEGTTHILSSINEIKAKRIDGQFDRRELALDTYPVLSRLGLFLSEERAAEYRRKAAQQLHADAEKVLYLRTDPDLEGEWHLHIPVTQEKPPENTALTNDYLRIIATILPDLVPGASVEEKILKIRESLDLGETIDHHYKTFRLDEGVLINMSDEQRNVSFKVNTFCSILDDFHNKMIEELLPTHRKKTHSKVEEEFYQAGSISGQRFGVGLAKLWDNRGAKDDLAGLLQFWCQFDSDIGFGELSAKLSKQEPMQGAMKIKGNFLAANRTSLNDPANLCMLLAGYIAGVLHEVTGRKFKVKHPPAHCLRTTPQRADCQFNFKEEI